MELGSIPRGGTITSIKYSMEYEIKSVFGPKIYKSRLDNDAIDLLKTVAEQSKKDKSFFGHMLAGNIEQQFAAQFNIDQQNQFLQIIYEHVHTCAVEFDKNLNRIFGKTGVTDITYNLGPGPWLNVQRAGEFNPAHQHTGNLSVVIYIDIPPVIAEENQHTDSEIKSPVAGIISFIHGDDSYWYNSIDHHIPKTGDILIFPASLKHSVYPFKSPVERVSMAFNVYDITVDNGP